jgi:hypothetical protein
MFVVQLLAVGCCVGANLDMVAATPEWWLLRCGWLSSTLWLLAPTAVGTSGCQAVCCNLQFEQGSVVNLAGATFCGCGCASSHFLWGGLLLLPTRSYSCNWYCQGSVVLLGHQWVRWPGLEGVVCTVFCSVLQAISCVGFSADRCCQSAEL